MLKDICFLALLILINGFLSLSELAVVSVNLNKVKLRADDGDKKCALIKNIREDPSNFFGTIQTGSTFVSIFTGAYASNVFAEPIFDSILQVYPHINHGWLAIIIILTTIVVSYCTLVFGELVPKRLAISKSMEISRFVAGIISVMSTIFMPITKILTLSADIIIKILRVKEDIEDDITEEEIRMMVDASSEAGAIDESELEMINAVFEFDDKTAGEIITHRKKLIAIDVNSTTEVLKGIVKERFSRIPVYEENIDNIVGILYTRDLLEYIVNDNTIESIDIRKIMRKPFFVHESKKTDDLFKQMQKDKLHMTIVVDEYGGTIGIVTMEDIIEEIMGNIQDEFDEEEEVPQIQLIYDNAYMVDGTISLSDAANFFDAEIDDDEYDTLSGFLIGMLGHIPDVDTCPELECSGIVFKVHEMEEKRIKTIIACILPSEEKP